MHDYENIAIIIPALNESLTVAAVVTKAQRFGCDIYVVDDNSEDNTREKALNAGAKVLSLPFTTGAWSAIQAGMLYAMKQKRYDFFITMDADGQHEAEHIPTLVESTKQTGANVVIGSFPQRGSWARRVAWLFFSLITRLKIKDVTSGFKLYDRKAVESLLCKQAAMLDYQDLGVLLMLRRKKMHCIEAPISMRPREDGCSRVFDSWFSVTIYLIKTCLLILSEWIARTEDSPEKWTEYDAL